MKNRILTSKFKAKVDLEAHTERYDLHPSNRTIGKIVLVMIGILKALQTNNLKFEYNMHKSLNLFGLLLLVNMSITPVFSQSTPKEYVREFFTNYEVKGSTYALNELYASNPWMSKAQEAIIKLKDQMEGLTEDFIGKYFGYELIVEKNLTNSYILLSYLVKFDRQPIRFTFQFYKPSDTWKIYSFQYDANLSTELEESAKLYYNLYGQ